MERPAAARYPRGMMDEPACCGACAHLAAAGSASTSRPPLRFEIGPGGVPRGAWIVVGDRAVAVDRPVIVVGRARDCDLVIADRVLSRRTCSISFDDDGRCFVTDLQSTCGVVVDGERVARAGLHEGDRIYVGNTVLTIERRT